MKQFYVLTAAVLLLAGCQNEELTNDVNSSKNSPEISFGISMPAPTRAMSEITGKEAAEKLSCNFLVQGFKYYGDEPTMMLDIMNPAKQQEVFDYYNVNYQDGTAQTTQSNTSGWEYAGFKSQAGDDQTIKYWDYEASGYVFSAISGTGISGWKIESSQAVQDVYGKGWNVTVPAGGSLADLYASARTPMPKPATGKEYETVKLTFYSMVTKVRFAIYETVPGYTVSIDKFYYKDGASWKNSTSNFAVNGDFRTLNPEQPTTLKVTYYGKDSGVENRPKVSYADGGVSGNAYKLFGTNIQAQKEIGTSSVTATYDQSGSAYTYILPYQGASNVLDLYVDYTLTAANGEQIHIKHASAHVPAQYTQWKENFAYTYLFKITDKTNGTTGTTDNPDDPTVEPQDPAGLYPITFDACVINSEMGIQENITSVSEPSVTTYQNGTIITENDEYKAGDIYYTVMTGGSLANISSASKVFEVQNFGTEETSEAIVKNYATNFVVLTPVTVTEATEVPASDGTSIKFAQGYCNKFVASAGKIYAIQYTDAKGTAYKLVKIAGTDGKAPSYKVSNDAGQVISTAEGTVSCRLTNTNGSDANKSVVGAKALFTVKTSADKDVTDKFVVTDNGNGEYVFALTDEAIKAGADDMICYIYFNGEIKSQYSFRTNLQYALSQISVEVVAGGTTASTVLTIGEAKTPLADAVIDMSSAAQPGLTVADTNHNGTYTVAADASVANGTYFVTIAGKQLRITVNEFSFSADKLLITMEYGKTSTGAVSLKKNGSYSGIAYNDLEGKNDEIATGNGTSSYTLTAKKGGKFTLKYENTQCEVTVNEYNLTANNTTVKRATGFSTITLTCNGVTSNASTAAVVCKSQPDGSAYSLTANGKTLLFGNATKAGNYVFQYKTSDITVAQITITVEE